MRVINKIIDTCELALAGVAGAAMGFLLLAICYSTFTRFAFNDPKSNLVEYSAYALVYVAFLAAPWILKNHGHINVDMVEVALPEVGRQILKICTGVMGLVICAIITYYGTIVTISNIQNDIRVLDSMNTPQFMLVGVVPIGCFFLCIQFIRNIAEDVKLLKEAKAAKKAGA